ncbi:MAG: hypothetical protein JEZ01_14925 [Labilibaculum sp.]|nr:hypothetical protein [Labilibaculum sp.]MBI9059056.1 hypothetical protein [Labilibaculum sp.]
MKRILSIIIMSMVLFVGCDDDKIIYDGPWFASFEFSEYQMSIDGEVRIPINLNTKPIDKSVTVSLNLTSDLAAGEDFTGDNLETVVFEPGQYSDTIVIRGNDTYFVGTKSIEIKITDISDPDFSVDIVDNNNIKVKVTPSFLIESFQGSYTCDANNSWVSSVDLVEGQGAVFNMWFSDMLNGENSVHIEREGRPFVGQEVDGILQITMLEEGDEIGPDSQILRDYGWESNWRRISTLCSPTKYTVWNGKTGYVGLELSVGGKAVYAWVKMSVREDGLSASVIEWAYEVNGKPIKAGQK